MTVRLAVWYLLVYTEVVRYPRFPPVRFRNNLIVKLLYWPTILLVLLVVTLWLFVYGQTYT